MNNEEMKGLLTSGQAVELPPELAHCFVVSAYGVTVCMTDTSLHSFNSDFKLVGQRNFQITNVTKLIQTGKEIVALCNQ